MEYIKTEHYDHVRNDYGREMVIPSEREWAEVKRGRWIKSPCECICSCCLVEEVYASDFCPNCGARMEASDD